MSEIRELHPLKKHLSREGIVVQGWIRSRGLPKYVALQCIYNGYYHPETIAKLREEDLYKFLTYKVRDRIEQAEKKRGVAANGN